MSALSNKSFASLSEDGYSLLMSIAEFKKLKKAEVLLHESQVCKHVYFVETGYLKAVHNNDGKEVNLSFTFPGNFTTNLKSLRNAVPSGYNIQACKPAMVWKLEKDKLFDLYTQSPEIGAFGRNLLEQLLIVQEEHANIFKLNTPAERYQYILTHNPELLQKVSLTDLASYLAISRETLSRTRKKYSSSIL